MKCSSCGESLYERSKRCPKCGKKPKRPKKHPFLVLTLLSLFVLILSALFFIDRPERPVQSVTTESKVTDDSNDLSNFHDPAPKQETELKPSTSAPLPEPVEKPAEEIKEEAINDIAALISDSQTKVFTIYTDSSQGSGFLFNQNGDIITNAHVVEGYTWVTIIDSNGNEYHGQVIGYSNHSDVALIRSGDLASRIPMELEITNKAKVGDEVVALGSPQGMENTATLGFITGVDRSFYIGSRSYSNIYQMSAPISAGSSGGPLVSTKTGKAIAINSAKMLGEEAIGFSIPLQDVYSIIQGWAQHPMTEQDIFALFYNESGDYYYEDLENKEEWFFDGGDYTEEEDTHTYYEIPEEWYDENPNEENKNEEKSENSYLEEAKPDDSDKLKKNESIEGEELNPNQDPEEEVENETVNGQ